jgi:hypothetical protein
MVRLFFIEQLYRGFYILKNEPIITSKGSKQWTVLVFVEGRNENAQDTDNFLFVTVGR